MTTPYLLAISSFSNIHNLQHKTQARKRRKDSLNDYQISCRLQSALESLFSVYFYFTKFSNLDDHTRCEREGIHLNKIDALNYMKGGL